MLKELIFSVQKLSNKNEEQFGKNNDVWPAIAVIVIIVLWVLLLVFLGKYLWNSCLVPATKLKEVTFYQFIGIFILIQILLPVIL